MTGFMVNMYLQRVFVNVDTIEFSIAQEHVACRENKVS